ncbi:MAG: helix-turn-helix domain-containing protein, partial [Sedimentibacter sp.]
VFISNENIEKLAQYDWPGNIRELENYIELIVNTEVVPDIYNLNFETNPVAYDNSKLQSSDFVLCSLKDLEKDHIIKVIDSTNKNITQAALVLGIGRNTLYRKMKEFHIECYAS